MAPGEWSGGRRKVLNGQGENRSFRYLSCTFSTWFRSQRLNSFKTFDYSYCDIEITATDKSLKTPWVQNTHAWVSHASPGRKTMRRGGSSLHHCSMNTQNSSAEWLLLTLKNNDKSDMNLASHLSVTLPSFRSRGSTFNVTEFKRELIEGLVILSSLTLLSLLESFFLSITRSCRPPYLKMIVSLRGESRVFGPCLGIV